MSLGHLLFVGKVFITGYISHQSYYMYVMCVKWVTVVTHTHTTPLQTSHSTTNRRRLHQPQLPSIEDQQQPSHNIAPLTKPESHTHLALANDRSSICSCMKGQTMANSRVETNGWSSTINMKIAVCQTVCMHGCLLQRTT